LIQQERQRTQERVDARWTQERQRYFVSRSFKP